MRIILLFFGLALCSLQANAQRAMMGASFQKGGDVNGRAALGLCCTTQASLGNNPSVMNVFSDIKSKFGNTTFTKQSGYAKIKGTAYLDEDFEKATIYAHGEEAATFYVRYDAFNDDIEVKRNKYNINKESLVRSENITCKVDGKMLAYQTFVDDEGVYSKGYLQKTYESEGYTIYVRNRKIYKEGKAAKTSLGTDFPPRFLDRTEYYVSKGKKVPKHIKLKKKEVLAFFEGGIKKKMENYIKNRRIKFETPADLVSVFDYADEMTISGVAATH